MSVHPRSLAGRLIRRRGQGFTVVEILIATAITAVIMLGLCAAVNATIQSCNATESMIESSGKARLALGNIERAVRKADAVVRTSATRLDVVDETGKVNAYVYDATNKRLNYLLDNQGNMVTLARNVSAIDFSAESEPDPETQVNRIVRLTASITVTSGGQSQTFKTSIAPRRARTYQ